MHARLSIRVFPSMLLGLILYCPSISAEGTDKPALSLKNALLLALESHPNLSASQAGILSAEARYERAKLRPNPAMARELENFAGSGDTTWFFSSEITVAFTQLVELGGKRNRRGALANALVDVAANEYRRTRMRVLRDVTLAFLDLAEAQYQVETDRQILLAAESLFRSVSANVSAGKVAPVEEVKANVELSRVRVKALKTRNSIIYQRDRLAASTGLESLPFETVSADLLNARTP